MMSEVLGPVADQLPKRSLLALLDLCCSSAQTGSTTGNVGASVPSGVRAASDEQQQPPTPPKPPPPPARRMCSRHVPRQRQQRADRRGGAAAAAAPSPADEAQQQTEDAEASVLRAGQQAPLPAIPWPAPEGPSSPRPRVLSVVPSAHTRADSGAKDVLLPASYSFCDPPLLPPPAAPLVPPTGGEGTSALAHGRRSSAAGNDKGGAAEEHAFASEGDEEVDVKGVWAAAEQALLDLLAAMALLSVAVVGGFVAGGVALTAISQARA